MPKRLRNCLGCGRALGSLSRTGKRHRSDRKTCSKRCRMRHLRRRWRIVAALTAHSL